MVQHVYDISPLISPELAVFPGDTAPTREVLLDMKRGDHLTLSTLRTTVHLGAHVDAPSHYGRNDATIESQPLEVYLGVCEVLSIRGARGRRIGVHDLPRAVSRERVLFRTDSYPDPTCWNDDFSSLEPALVDHLHERGVRLVGIDTPSVDPADAKTLDAHRRFLANGMCILEGIVLREVPDGVYELIALPLRLSGFDASPVRAVLRTLDASQSHE